METSAKTAYNVEESFLKTSTVIYQNIDKGVYDLSSDKSGIRVGNESTTIASSGGGPRLDTKNKSSSGGGMCC
jgi:GTPase SAR1 family protein